MADDLAAWVPRLAAARVACVGDVMLDRYVFGAVERISPEAPVPVLRVERETAMLGGAGNVVRNLAALGAEAGFVAVVGDDPAGREIVRLIADEPGMEPHLLIDPKRPTTIKTRFLAGSQQMLRADRETAAAVPDAVADDLVRRAAAAIAEAQAVVLSDYGKGVLTPETSAALIAAARAAGKPVVIDPKGRDYAARYAGATLLTPNRRELAEATGMATGTDDEIVAACLALIEACGLDGVLATRSQDGMTLVRRPTEPGAAPAVTHVPATAREVFDVSGAGDTVIAVLAAAIAAGAPWADACRLANAAAGIVVAKLGAATASREELAAAVRGGALRAADAKVLDRAGLLARLAAWRAQGLKIGFTNGCFDLLHPGHVSLIAQARAACDRLIVALNDDASVARLKGPTRPVQGEAARAVVLASLADVDAVTLFAEDTPLDLIRAVRPDVLVKGADYTVATVVGAADVQAYGGKVVLADLTPGQSTTGLIAKSRG